MRTRHFLAIAASAFSLAVPTLSQASSDYHFVGGEAGYVYYPGHVQSQKTRAEVRSDLEVARQNGSLIAIQRGLPMPLKSAGPGKTRAEVLSEVYSESPEERRARTQLYRGG